MNYESILRERLGKALESSNVKFTAEMAAHIINPEWNIIDLTDLMSRYNIIDEEGYAYKKYEHMFELCYGKTLRHKGSKHEETIIDMTYLISTEGLQHLLRTYDFDNEEHFDPETYYGF